MDINSLLEFLFFVLIGFGAQMIDGALGMAYGVISTGVLVGFGVPPMVASASVHTAEIVTTAVSGISHVMVKNVDWILFRKLVLPGILGSIIGAYILTKTPPSISKPLVAIYFSCMGLVILYRVTKEGSIMHSIRNFTLKRLEKKLPSKQARGLGFLGFAGGFFDASGGGGWGSIVGSTLLAQGTTAHYTIGSVNTTEFLITISSSLTFFLTIGISHWNIISGLIAGGIIAAPLAALVVRKIKPNLIMLMAGILVLILGLITMIRTII